jgi:membrane protease YdiL (CAAX protease family)
VDEALRVTGRLAVLAGITMVLVFLLGVALKPVLPMGLPPGREGRLLLSFLLAVALALGHTAVTLIFERARWEVAGLGRFGWHPFALVGGVALGAVSVALPAAALLLGGVATLEARPSGDWGAHAAGVAGEAALIALTQALIWRGYAFGLIQQRWGAAPAIALSALGATGVAWWSYGMTLAAFVAVLALGVLLGAIRARTSSVAGAWLAHAAFLWVAVGAFHSADPRLTATATPDYVMLLGAPTVLSGGEGGVGLGLAAAAACAVAAGFALRRRSADSR